MSAVIVTAGVGKCRRFDVVGRLLSFPCAQGAGLIETTTMLHSGNAGLRFATNCEPGWLWHHV